MLFNSEFRDTAYFFVGGFDLQKGEELIKLYKINFNGKLDSIEIEYIKDVIFENNDNFKSPITCITQSKKSGNIIVTFINGYAFLFRPEISLF